jgi:hypothetical protein
MFYSTSTNEKEDQKLYIDGLSGIVLLIINMSYFQWYYISQVRVVAYRR